MTLSLSQFLNPDAVELGAELTLVHCQYLLKKFSLQLPQPKKGDISLIALLRYDHILHSLLFLSVQFSVFLVNWQSSIITHCSLSLIFLHSSFSFLFLHFLLLLNFVVSLQ